MTDDAGAIANRWRRILVGVLLTAPLAFCVMTPTAAYGEDRAAADAVPPTRAGHAPTGLTSRPSIRFVDRQSTDVGRGVHVHYEGRTLPQATASGCAWASVTRSAADLTLASPSDALSTMRLPSADSSTVTARVVLAEIPPGWVAERPEPKATWNAAQDGHDHDGSNNDATLTHVLFDPARHVGDIGIAATPTPAPETATPTPAPETATSAPIHVPPTDASPDSSSDEPGITQVPAHPVTGPRPSSASPAAPATDRALVTRPMIRRPSMPARDLAAPLAGPASSTDAAPTLPEATPTPPPESASARRPSLAPMTPSPDPTDAAGGSVWDRLLASPLTPVIGGGVLIAALLLVVAPPMGRCPRG